MLFYWLIISMATAGMWLAVHTIAASIYDLQLSKIEKDFQTHPNARRYRTRPRITLLIATQNDQAVIIDCLRSIANGEYRKYEIIVVDHKSQDDTPQLVRQFIKQHPKQAIRLVTKQTVPLSVNTSLRASYRRHGHGSLVAILEPTMLLSKQALSWTARHFNRQPNLDVLIGHTQYIGDDVFSLLKMMPSLVSQYRYKLSQVMGWIALDPPLRVQTKQSFLADQQIATANHYYAYNVIATQNTHMLKGTDTMTATWLIRLVANSMKMVRLGAPIPVIYSLYLALVLHNSNLLLYGWIALMVALWLLIWGDTMLPASRRWLLTATAPVMLLPAILYSCKPLYDFARNHQQARIIPQLSAFKNTMAQRQIFR